MDMKTINIMSWNVNGLRAVLNKGLLTFLKEENPHILGIQETKIQEHQLPEGVRSPKPFSTAWNFAERKVTAVPGCFTETLLWK